MIINLDPDDHLDDQQFFAKWDNAVTSHLDYNDAAYIARRLEIIRDHYDTMAREYKQGLAAAYKEQNDEL